MPVTDNQIAHMRQYCVRLLRWYVFADVIFANKDERDIVYDSYVQNLDAMIEYATKNNINIEKHFKEIRAILLKTHNVRRRTK